MKTTDFAECVTKYFSVYLPGIKNYSDNTLKSYNDVFRQFLSYCQDIEGLNLQKIDFPQINDGFVLRFINWLKVEHGCSVSSQNQRLAALRAFFRYAVSEYPQHFSHLNKLINIPLQKRERPIIQYLQANILKDYLALPDMSTASGRRDAALLSLLYDTGARVSEIVGVSMGDIRFDNPAVIKLTGKGRKTRLVPLMTETAALLKDYITENDLAKPEMLSLPLFFNKQKKRLTRSGVGYVVQKYAAMLPDNQNRKISPHTFRHSKAMHLLQADINIIYIRDLLGHTDIKTTEAYARADIEMKRKALQKIQSNVPAANGRASWKQDENLLSWLNSLSKSK
jgi:site-specific recombinase XerD